MIKTTIYGNDLQKVKAVDQVNLELERGSVQGIIGESGCGKTTLLFTLIGLLQPTEGTIRIDGNPTDEFSKRDWKEYRRRVQIIFQDPFNSLDPKYTVYETLNEMLTIHGMDNKDERINSVLDDVELQPIDTYLHKTSNQLSGGELQRVAIARALILEPDIILADEPVSMLDVSTQAAILRLLGNMCQDKNVSMLYISHDLSTVSYVCDHVNVMYLGRIIENAPTGELLNDPKHPYTQALINAIPIPDPSHHRRRVQLDGTPSDPINLPTGCRFKDRCPERMEVCDKTPDYKLIEDSGRKVACHLYGDHDERAPRSNQSKIKNHD